MEKLEPAPAQLAQNHLSRQYRTQIRGLATTLCPSVNFDGDAESGARRDDRYREHAFLLSDGGLLAPVHCDLLRSPYRAEDAQSRYLTVPANSRRFLRCPDLSRRVPQPSLIGAEFRHDVGHRHRTEIAIRDAGDHLAGLSLRISSDPVNRIDRRRLSPFGRECGKHLLKGMVAHHLEISALPEEFAVRFENFDFVDGIAISPDAAEDIIRSRTQRPGLRNDNVVIDVDIEFAGKIDDPKDVDRDGLLHTRQRLSSVSPTIVDYAVYANASASEPFARLSDERRKAYAEDKERVAADDAVVRRRGTSSSNLHEVCRTGLSRHLWICRCTLCCAAFYSH